MLIKKYIAHEFLLNVFYCLAGLCILHIIADVFNTISAIANSKPGIWLIIRYYISYMLPSIELIVPASLLLATLYTLWSMAHHSELIAMQANGISIRLVLSIFLKTGIIFSIILLIAKETFIPDMAFWAYNFQRSNFKLSDNYGSVPISFMNDKDLRIWYIREFNPNNPKKIKGVKVTQERPNGSRELSIEAEHAEWLDGEWWFFSPVIQRFNENDSPIRKDAMLGTYISKSMDFNETPEDFLAIIRPPDAQTIFHMKRYLDKHSRLSGTMLAEKWTDFHSHLAAPWACFIVVTFAIPIGVKTGRQSMLFGILGALILFFCFYTVNQIGIFLAKSQLIMPCIGAWLSNTLFFVIGVLMYLLRKA